MTLTRSFAAFLTLLALLVSGCTPVRNPVTGQVQYTAMTPEQEAAAGRQEHPKVLAQFGGAYRDPGLQAYVDRIGHSLAAVSQTPELNFTFTVLDSDEVNAFALPGGYVYVTRGLIALTDNEAELAGVIGHEIGHVAARHPAQRYDRQLQGQIGATVAQVGGAILGGLFGGEAGSQLGGSVGGQLGSLGATAYVQGYSREQEYQADELGVDYLGQAGYDPQAMASFLSTLQGSDALRAQMSGQAASQGAPSWLASHPRTVDRVERAISAAGEQGSGGALDQGRFLREIDGIVFGDSPSQGYVRGRTFIHPELGIRFEAPNGFKLRNTTQAVIGTDGRGRTMVFDATQTEAGNNAARYLQSEWVQGQRIGNVERLDLGDRTAAAAVTTATVNNQRAEVLLVAVPGSGRTMYRFAFFDTGGLSQGDIGEFEATVRSFGPLTAADRSLARPLRIDVVNTRPGDTIDSLAARMDVDRFKREWFVLLNELDRQPLRPGQPVKLIVREGGSGV